MNDKKLQKLIDFYEQCPLECDGMVQVLNTVLLANNVKCTVFGGTVSRHNVTVPLHFWIELVDRRFVDLRARMWLGNEVSVPHGIFRPQDYPEVVYKGRQGNFTPVSDTLFSILTNNLPILIL